MVCISLFTDRCAAYFATDGHELNGRPLFAEGGKRTISRFSLVARDDGVWAAAVSRHRNLDRADPRPGQKVGL
jgi:hypothetical protein